jgi:hypothetical protein
VVPPGFFRRYFPVASLREIWEQQIALAYYGGGGLSINVERLSPAKRKFFGDWLIKTKNAELKAQKEAADRAKKK